MIHAVVIPRTSGIRVCIVKIFGISQEKLELGVFVVKRDQKGIFRLRKGNRNYLLCYLKFQSISGEKNVRK